MNVFWDIKQVGSNNLTYLRMHDTSLFVGISATGSPCSFPTVEYGELISMCSKLIDEFVKWTLILGEML